MGNAGSLWWVFGAVPVTDKMVSPSFRRLRTSKVGRYYLPMEEKKLPLPRYRNFVDTYIDTRNRPYLSTFLLPRRFSMPCTPQSLKYLDVLGMITEASVHRVRFRD